MSVVSRDYVESVSTGDPGRKQEPLLAELSHFFEGEKARLLDANRRALRRGFSLIPKDHRHPQFFAEVVAGGSPSGPT